MLVTATSAKIVSASQTLGQGHGAGRQSQQSQAFSPAPTFSNDPARKV
jgi:hypothetical protein